MDEPKPHVPPTSNPLSALRSSWRSALPIRVLCLYIICNLAFSFGYLYFFCRYFGQGRRLAILHVIVVTGALLFLLLLIGFLFCVKARHSTRLARYGTAFILGSWFSALGLLYLADFVSNRLWGNDINYRLVSSYFFTHRILYNELLLPVQVYLALAGCLVLILVIHLALSNGILKGLEHLMGAGRASSTFRDRSRTLKSAVALGLLFIAYSSYLFMLRSNSNPNWPAELEPVTAFFRSDLYDATHDALAERLRTEEPRIRANYSHTQTFEKKNVIIIVVDSLRADHTQIYGYDRPTTPFLKRLSESGKLKKVDFATSTCSETNCGVLSTLSSKTLHSIIPEDFKLHDLLHDLGYRTHFIFSGGILDWYGLEKALGRDLTYFFDGANSRLYPSRFDDRLIFEGLNNVPNFQGIPSFFYLHLMSVHFAGFRQEQYRTYQPAAVVRDWNTLVRGKYNVTSLVNNYDNGIIQADAMIRQIFESLQTKGYLSNALVVILADHGEGLGDRGENGFGHVNSLYQEFIRIPLLIYDDSPTAYANLTYATQIDVAPTILARLGLSIPPSWQGQSLLGTDQNRYSFHQTRLVLPAYAILFRARGATYKYIYSSRDRKEELYELTSDPNEKNSLMRSADPSLIEQMRTKLSEYLTEH
jgi:glucan phosphoethanolaminetransferase (alkaline phosphatase superfamily)